MGELEIGLITPYTKLVLYEYCWPCDVLSHAFIKTAIPDPDGKFDFGSVKPSHYYLKIDDETGRLSDLFQVEVRGRKIRNSLKSSTSPPCTRIALVDTSSS